MSRTLPALAAGALLALGAAAPAHAASYTMCSNPEKTYTLVEVRGPVSCKQARGVAVATQYGRRNAFGYRCRFTTQGTYYGLFGTRMVCTKGTRRVRITSRGE